MAIANGLLALRVQGDGIAGYRSWTAIAVLGTLSATNRIDSRFTARDASGPSTGCCCAGFQLGNCVTV